MDKVILALSNREAGKCNFEYASLYVAFSRVKDRRNIRLLLCGRDGAEEKESVRHLFDLKPRMSVSVYLGSFGLKGGTGWESDSCDIEAARVRAGIPHPASCPSTAEELR